MKYHIQRTKLFNYNRKKCFKSDITAQEPTSRTGLVLLLVVVVVVFLSLFNGKNFKIQKCHRKTSIASPLWTTWNPGLTLLCGGSQLEPRSNSFLYTVPSSLPARSVFSHPAHRVTACHLPGPFSHVTVCLRFKYILPIHWRWPFNTINYIKLIINKMFFFIVVQL